MRRGWVHTTRWKPAATRNWGTCVDLPHPAQHSHRPPERVGLSVRGSHVGSGRPLLQEPVERQAVGSQPKGSRTSVLQLEPHHT